MSAFSHKRTFGSRGFQGDYSVENELKDALLRTEVRFGVGPDCVGLYLADEILQGALKVTGMSDQLANLHV